MDFETEHFGNATNEHDNLAFGGHELVNIIVHR